MHTGAVRVGGDWTVSSSKPSTESDALLLALADQLPAVVWTTDAGLRFTSSSGGGLSALGLVRDQVVGLSLRQYFGTEDDEHPAIDAHRRALKGEWVKYETEVQGRWYETQVAPFREADRVIGTVGMAIDVTDRKRAEQTGAALESRLRQKYKLEAVGQLASGLAHEINNPLQSVLNFAQLIRSRSEGPVREYADEILHEVQRIAASVRNLQSFVHQGDAVPAEIRLDQVVERTLSLFRTVMQKEQIRIEVDVAPDLPPAWGKVHAVQQVLVNLLTAARDAVNGRHPLGGDDKRIYIKAEARERGGERFVRLTIEDHGTAIRPEDLPRVFEPFVAIDGRDQGGGLGLAISHNIACESGAELSVESDGWVTRFHLDLKTAADG
jgi:PAS domain S-box-containing protein